MSKYRTYRPDPDHLERIAQVWSVFDADKLKQICEMHETDFAAYLDVAPTVIPEVRGHENYYYYQDNGSPILAVAHLDTCVDHDDRMTTFANTADGPVVHSGALDDRLGAYIILDLLPALGIEFDILLTVGEESGASTAEHFTSPKDFHWLIEFDRGGTDVVMYEYEDAETRALVKDCGAEVGLGSFSDISYLEHMEAKGFNWGVGYQDYHSVRGYAFLADTVEMVARFLKFHEVNKDEYLPHERSKYTNWWGGGSTRNEDEDPWLSVASEHTHGGEVCPHGYDCYEEWDQDKALDTDDHDAKWFTACKAGTCGHPEAVDEDSVIDNPTSEQMSTALAKLEGASS